MIKINHLNLIVYSSLISGYASSGIDVRNLSTMRPDGKLDSTINHQSIDYWCSKIEGHFYSPGSYFDHVFWDL